MSPPLIMLKKTTKKMCELDIVYMHRYTKAHILAHRENQSDYDFIIYRVLHPNYR